MMGVIAILFLLGVYGLVVYNFAIEQDQKDQQKSNELLNKEITSLYDDFFQEHYHLNVEALKAYKELIHTSYMQFKDNSKDKESK